MTAVCDPYFSSVSLSLPGTGANGAQVFTDVSSYGLTPASYGAAVVTSTAQSTVGAGSSIYLPGNQLLTFNATPQSPQDITNKDVTIEFWAYFINSGLNQQIVFSNFNPYTNSGDLCRFYLGSTNYGVWQSAGIAQTPSAVPIGQWVHFALVRRGLRETVFMNGVPGATSNNSTPLPGYAGVVNNYNAITFGGDSLSFAQASYCNFYLQDFRITQGIARYSAPASFTPPTTLSGGACGVLQTQLFDQTGKQDYVQNAYVGDAGGTAATLPVTRAYFAINSPTAGTMGYTLPGISPGTQRPCFVFIVSTYPQPFGAPTSVAFGGNACAAGPAVSNVGTVRQSRNLQAYVLPYSAGMTFTTVNVGGVLYAPLEITYSGGVVTQGKIVAQMVVLQNVVASSTINFPGAVSGTVASAGTNPVSANAGAAVTGLVNDMIISVAGFYDTDNGNPFHQDWDSTGPAQAALLPSAYGGDFRVAIDPTVLGSTDTTTFTAATTQVVGVLNAALSFVIRGGTGVATLSGIEGKFVPANIFKPVEISNIAGAIPRIYPVLDDSVVRIKP